MLYSAWLSHISHWLSGSYYDDNMDGAKVYTANLQTDKWNCICLSQQKFLISNSSTKQALHSVQMTGANTKKQDVNVKQGGAHSSSELRYSEEKRSRSAHTLRGDQ